MQITRASDYAVRVMIHLAAVPPDSTVRQSELARETDVPGHFLSKVLQQLVRARLIRSYRGSGGGYALAIPAASVTLLGVVEAIEGPVRLNQCLEEGLSCGRRSWCPAHEVWVEAQMAIMNVLGRISMESSAARAKAIPDSSDGTRGKPVWISGMADTPRKQIGHGN